MQDAEKALQTAKDTLTHTENNVEREIVLGGKASEKATEFDMKAKAHFHTSDEEKKTIPALECRVRNAEKALGAARERVLAEMERKKHENSAARAIAKSKHEKKKVAALKAKEEDDQQKAAALRASEAARKAKEEDGRQKEAALRATEAAQKAKEELELAAKELAALGNGKRKAR